MSSFIPAPPSSRRSRRTQTATASTGRVSPVTASPSSPSSASTSNPFTAMMKGEGPPKITRSHTMTTPGTRGRVVPPPTSVSTTLPNTVAPPMSAPAANRGAREACRTKLHSSSLMGTSGGGSDSHEAAINQSIFGLIDGTRSLDAPVLNFTPNLTRRKPAHSNSTPSGISSVPVDATDDDASDTGWSSDGTPRLAASPCSPSLLASDAVASSSPSSSSSSEMYVDLNSAFSQAFGSSGKSPTIHRRKGHSRGLSTVFVSPTTSSPSQAPANASRGAEAATSANPFAVSLSPPRQIISPSAGKKPISKSQPRMNNKPKKVEEEEEQVEPEPEPESDKVSKATRNLELREKILRELLSSEEEYVGRLSKLIQLFYRPMIGISVTNTGNSASRNKGALLSKQEADLLFGQIEVIFLYNTKLLGDLRERISSPDYDPLTTPISDVFLSMKSFLQVYVSYSENYSKGMKVYEVIMSRNTKTKKFVKKAEKDAGNILEAFLILPIQRIPRYILLLKEIIKNTEEQHPDYDALVEVVETIKTLCSAINQAPKRMEEAKLMLTIYKRIQPKIHDLLAPARKLIDRGAIWAVTDNNQVKTRYFFLFNDLLLVTRVIGDDFVLRYRISLPNVTIYDTPPQTFGGKKAYMVTIKAKGGKRIQLCFKQEEKRQKMYNGIKDHNPIIMHGTPQFLPMADRPKPKNHGKQAAPNGSHDGSASAPVSTDSTERGRASSRSSRRNKNAGRSRKSSRTRSAIGSPPSEGEFEVVRHDLQPKTDAVNPQQLSAPQLNPVDVRMKEISKLIAEKQTAQEDLQKLILFYKKCNDEEGERKAVLEISRYEREISVLKMEGVELAREKMSPRSQEIFDEGNNGKTHLELTSSSGGITVGKKSPRMTEAMKVRRRSVSVSSPSKRQQMGRSRSESVSKIPASAQVSTLGTSGSPKTKKVMADLMEAASNTSPIIVRQCKALYDFNAVNEGELSFKAGDTMTLLSTKGGEWYFGALESGQDGWFPASYCEMIKNF